MGPTTSYIIIDKVKYLQEVNQPAKKQNNNKQTTNKFGSDLLPTDSNHIVFADLKINCFFALPLVFHAA